MFAYIHYLLLSSKKFKIDNNSIASNIKMIVYLFQCLNELLQNFIIIINNVTKLYNKYNITNIVIFLNFIIKLIFIYYH